MGSLEAARFSQTLTLWTKHSANVVEKWTQIGYTENNVDKKISKEFSAFHKDNMLGTPQLQVNCFSQPKGRITNELVA